MKIPGRIIGGGAALALICGGTIVGTAVARAGVDSPAHLGTSNQVAVDTIHFYTRATNTVIQPGQNAPGDAYCNTGDHATGGGYTPSIQSISDYTQLGIGYSQPVNNDKGWGVDVYNNSPDTLTLNVVVVCEHL